MPRRMRIADILYDITQEIYASALRLNCPKNFASLFLMIQLLSSREINWL
jgi:hypothetical protein